MEFSDFYEKTENMSEFVTIKLEKTVNGRKNGVGFTIISD